MYYEHFGLSENPFSIAPDPRYLYMSERHREALAHLVYGLNSDGAFILLTGDVGTGKTTVSRCLLEQIPDDTNLALVLNPKVSALELLETICDELLGRHAPAEQVHNSVGHVSIKILVDIINRYLLEAHAQGKKTVVLIEEAQNLDLDVLEQLRLLTNLETNEHKLLQIILLGQPELLDVLDKPELSQLAQRITARYHLSPLNEKEMVSYVSHRLAVAGCRQKLFPALTLKRLYKLSKGIPRVVNVLCDRALLGSYVQNKTQVDIKTLENAAREVLGDKTRHKKNNPARTLAWSATLASVLALTIGALVYFYPEAVTENVAELSAVLPENNIPPDAEQNSDMPEKIEKPEKTEQIVTAMPQQAEKLRWPDETQRLRSNSLAYQSLFRRWNLEYDPQTDGTPCFYAQKQGLACLHGHADMDKLRTFNRPAILKLFDEQQRSYFVTLTGMGNQLALLDVVAEQQALSVDQINKYWNGEFTLLWHQPPGYQNSIHPGHQGDDVLWLTQKLNQLDSTNVIPEVSIYQSELIDKVRRFQLSRGLVDDGIVGVITLMHINNATGAQAPVLENNG
ncbi:MAG: AAA family ATPase [Gammaproteobacteria bacterium]|nr:AAA family ATPase [Gammaproteobacteria bacterium]